MVKWNWKKGTALLCAAVCAAGIGAGSGRFSAAAAEVSPIHVVALGDDCLVAGTDGSSAADLAAAYFDGTASNQAQLHQTSAQLVEQLKSDSTVRQEVRNADVIFVSSGVNDLLNTVFFDNPYVPNASSYTTLSGMLRGIPSGAPTMIIQQVISTLPDQVAQTNANLQTAVQLIHQQNPTADIVVQNVLNPMAVNINAMGLSPKRAEAATELFYYLDVCLNGGSYTSAFVGAASEMTISTGINTVVQGLDQLANVSVADYAASYVGTGKQESMGFFLTDIGNLQMTFTPVGQVFLASALLEADPLLAQGDGSVIGAAYTATGQQSSLQAERAEMDQTIQTVSQRTVTAYTLGDVDGDSSVGIQDAFLTLSQYAVVSAGGDNTLNPAQRRAADADGNQEISIQDAFLWLQYYSMVNAGSSITLDEFLKQYA